jgi:hypothetical protein
MRLDPLDSSKKKSIMTEEEKKRTIIAKKNGKIKPGYNIANFQAALEHLFKYSYRKKIVNGLDGGDDYIPLETCGPNSELKEYGLGIYLYFEFIKRLGITLFIMSAILGFALITLY